MLDCLSASESTMVYSSGIDICPVEKPRSVASVMSGKLIGLAVCGCVLTVALMITATAESSLNQPLDLSVMTRLSVTHTASFEPLMQRTPAPSSILIGTAPPCPQDKAGAKSPIVDIIAPIPSAYIALGRARKVSRRTQSRSLFMYAPFLWLWVNSLGLNDV